jgi:arylsulfatase A
MNGRTLIRFLSMSAFPAVCAWLALFITAVGADQRPNVVVLLADDLGSKDIGCDGGPVKTPALDGLAAKGVRFTDFHSGAAVCSPSRATLLTGRQHMRTGVYTVIQDHMHNMHLKKSEVTIAEVLQAQGYGTAHIGKWHLGTPFRGRDKPWIEEHGFDYWFATDLNAAPSHRNPENFWRNGKRVGELKGYACQLVVDEAIRWLEQIRDPKKPFFLNVWLHEPHAPLAAPDHIVSEYGDLNDPAAIYSGTIDNTDRAIARLLKKLEDAGSLENTILIYASDHGSYRPDRNGSLRGSKGSLFEGGIRTPGIFHWPKGIPGGRLERTPAGAVDLLPTICGLLGIDKPEGVRLDGADLSPLLTGKPDEFSRRQPLFWHAPTGQPNVAIRDGNFTLMGYRKLEMPKDQSAIRSVMEKIEALLEKELGRQLTSAELWNKAYNTDFKTPEGRRLRSEFVTLNTFQEAWIPLIKSGSGGFRKFELYDLSTDPNQKNDIADQFPDVAKRLKEQAIAINARVLEEAPEWGPYTPLVAAKPNPKPSLRDADLEELLTEIDAAGLPDGYHGATHQTYVDNRLAALAPEQRARVGTLYKEKRRLHPNMPNRGTSFVKILEYVAAGEKQGKKSKAEPAATGKRHLFILSGQSNMAGLDPTVSFTPAVRKKFGRDNVIVVKLARGGQPIRRWYKNRKSANGAAGKNNGDLYDMLMQQVRKAVEGKKIASVTFVWMQGERDAKTKEFSVYGKRLKGVVEQLQGDLKRKDINVVVGKLGKGQLEGKPWSKDWAALRKVQEDLCKADPRWEIVNCDDLEMKADKLHFSAEGYKGMGERFAATAIRLITAKKMVSSETIRGKVVQFGKPIKGFPLSSAFAGAGN